jgi:hypothetical protein
MHSVGTIFDMGTLVQILRKEWHVIRAAPWSFITVWVLAIGIGFAAVRSYYKDKLTDGEKRASQWKSDADYWKEVAARPKECPPDKSTPSPSNPVKTDKPKPISEHLPIQQNCDGGNCATSIGQQGGITAGQINLGPPPLKLVYSIRELHDEEQPVFGFDRKKCPIITHMRIVPNQSVPPPVRVALDFTLPVSKIETTVEGVGTVMRGGPFTVGLHAISGPVSPGIGPSNPLIVEVCSERSVQLTDEPQLVN